MRTFLRPSTGQFVQEARSLQGYSFIDSLHAFIYLRWPYLYISIANGEHPLARLLLRVGASVRGVLLRAGVQHRSRTRESGTGRRWKRTFADTYHGKVVPLNAAIKLVSVNKEIHLAAPEHVIPYAAARDIVLKHPDHIVVLQCPCRTSRRNPCTPLDVCLIVGEPFAGFTVDHHPDRSRRITPAEAVDILRAEEARGHVHHAFFKDAMLGRFYAICNCCSCCCGAMQAFRNGIPMLASSGYVAVLDRTACVSCGTCEKYCQFHAVAMVDGVKTIDQVKCMGCGVCVSKCVRNAVSLKNDPSRGVPLEIEELMATALHCN
jgi:Pyruvate/2-oxoacid:ferredoxin oxidoreductase delta subunit